MNDYAYLDMTRVLYGVQCKEKGCNSISLRSKIDKEKISEEKIAEFECNKCGKTLVLTIEEILKGVWRC
ncbi:MAG: hypothetical protein ABIJ97_08625 [Bacteroidota bacterium]